MRFRPCIDLHGGKVKQIVGSTLGSENLKENFVSELPPEHYARRFAADGLRGGHVIMLGGGSEAAARAALSAAPGTLQVGGGVNASNAEGWLEAGASHVIVTSAVFSGGEFDESAAAALCNAVGRDRLVLDFSCARVGGKALIVSGRWKDCTLQELTPSFLARCDRWAGEYLIHAVSREGLLSGPDEELVSLLSEYAAGGIPLTYAGGIASMRDLRRFAELSSGRLDFTVGSALDIYGGSLPYRDVAAFTKY